MRYHVQRNLVGILRTFYSCAAAVLRTLQYVYLSLVNSNFKTLKIEILELIWCMNLCFIWNLQIWGTFWLLNFRFKIQSTLALLDLISQHCEWKIIPYSLRISTSNNAHNSTWDQHWAGDETVKWVLIYIAQLPLVWWISGV